MHWRLCTGVNKREEIASYLAMTRLLFLFKNSGILPGITFGIFAIHIPVWACRFIAAFPFVSFIIRIATVNFRRIFVTGVGKWFGGIIQSGIQLGFGLR